MIQFSDQMILDIKISTQIEKPHHEIVILSLFWSKIKRYFLHVCTCMQILEFKENEEWNFYQLHYQLVYGVDSLGRCVSGARKDAKEQNLGVR